MSKYMRVYYKCRLCGEIYSDQTIPKSKTIKIMTAVVREEYCRSTVGIHYCNNGDIGCADFLGVKEETDE